MNQSYFLTYFLTFVLTEGLRFKPSSKPNFSATLSFHLSLVINKFWFKTKVKYLVLVKLKSPTVVIKPLGQASCCFVTFFVLQFYLLGCRCYLLLQTK